MSGRIQPYLSRLARSVALRFRRRPPVASRPNRSTPGRVEPLEYRVLLTIQWDYAGGFNFKNTLSPLQHWNPPNVVRNQLVRVVATYLAGGAPTDDNRGTVFVRADNDTKRIDLNGHGDVGEAVVTVGDYLPDVGYSAADRFDVDDYAAVTAYKQRLNNLSVVGPTLNGDGSVTYGYRTSGDSELVFRGFTEVELYWAKGTGPGDLLKRLDGHAGLSATAAGDVTYNVPKAAFDANPPPAGTTHLVAVVDRSDLALESDDRWGDNSRAVPLPNLKASVPFLRTGGAAVMGYQVVGAPVVTDAELGVQAWYASAPDWDHRLKIATGEGYIDRVVIDKNPGGERTFELSSDKMVNPPPGAAYLVVAVDPFGLAIEANEGDNVQAIKLPDFKVEELTWDGKGGAVLKYSVNDGSMPGLAKPGAVFEWLSDDGSVTSVARAAISKKPGTYTVELTPSRLARDMQYEYTSLRVRLDPAEDPSDITTDPGLVAESDESNNVRQLTLPHRLSIELADAPPAATEADRVRLWMAKYERDILRQAKRWHIDPRAVAAAIAWEALYNVKTTGSSTYGPGKLHWVDEDNPFNGGVGAQVEARGYIVPNRTTLGRRSYVLTPKGAIEYIAAIEAAYADVAEKYLREVLGNFVIDVRHNTAALVTWYNGGAGDLDTYDQNLNATRPNPYLPNPGANAMGNWVAANIGDPKHPRYVDYLLVSRLTPTQRKRKPPQPRNVRARSAVGRGAIITPISPLPTAASPEGGLPAEDDDPFVLAGASRPKAGEVTRIGGSLVYIPNADFRGADSFDYYLRDDEGVVYGGEVTVDVGDTPGDQPILTARQTDASAATLSWAPATAAVAQYVIERGQPFAEWQQLAVVDGTARSFVDTQVVPGSTYYYRVVGRTGGAVPDEISNPARVAVASALGPPSDLRWTYKGEFDVGLQWDDNSFGETGFVVEISTDGIRWAAAAAALPPDRTSVDVLNLRPGGTYQFRVRALAGGSLSDPSDVLSVSTIPPDVPELFASDARSTRVDLHWFQATTGDVGYRVEQSTDRTNWTLAAVVPGDRTSFRVGGLTANTRYFFRVKALLSGDDVIATSPSVRVVTAPAKPGGLSVTSATPDAVSLAWRDVDGEERYEVDQSTDGGQTWSLGERVPADHPYCVRTDLAPRQSYMFRVRAVNAVGSSDASDAVQSSVTRGTPDTPGGLTARATSPTAVALTWSAVVGVEHYVIYQSTDGGASYQFGENVPGTLTAATRDGLVPGRSYAFVVTAANAYGESDPSAPASARTAAGTPNPPSALTVTGRGPDQIALRFADNSDDEDYFEAYESVDGGATFRKGEAIPADHPYFTRTGLTPSTSYLIHVRAGNRFGTSAWSDPVAVSTTDGRADRPTGLAARADSPTSVALDWRGVSGVDHYEVEQSTNGGASWTFGENVPGTLTACVRTGLQANQAYAFRVFAVNAYGRSAPSDPASATTPKGTPPPPGGLSGRATSPSSAYLAWNEVSGEDHYEVWQSTNGGATWSLGENVPADHPYCTRTDLRAEQRYLFRVYAVNGFGRSDPSNEADVTTPRGTPDPPGGLAARADSPTSVVLGWQAVAGVDHYEVEQSLDGGATWAFGENVPGTLTACVRDGLSPGRAYVFRVFAVNAYGRSAPGATASATTPKASVATPTGLHVVKVSSTYAVIAWNEVSGESSYRVEISRDNSNWSFKENVPADHAYSDQLDGLLKSTRYYVRVKAVDAAGRQTDPSTVVTFVTTATALIASSSTTSAAARPAAAASSVGSEVERGRPVAGVQLAPVTEPTLFGTRRIRRAPAAELLGA